MCRGDGGGEPGQPAQAQGQGRAAARAAPGRDRRPQEGQAHHGQPGVRRPLQGEAEEERRGEKLDEDMGMEHLQNLTFICWSEASVRR